MGIEDDIEKLEELIKVICPHKRVEVDKNMNELYTCLICKQSQWAKNVKEFRKKCEEDLDDYEL